MAVNLGLHSPLHAQLHSLSLASARFLRPTSPRLFASSPSHHTRFSGSHGVFATLTLNELDQASNGGSLDSREELLACPVCFEPLIRKGPPGMNLVAISRCGFKCSNCRKAYSTRDVFLDLTITAGAKEYEEYSPAGTQIFRSPIVSFVYERGWRQSFGGRGFPGPDEEVNLAYEFLKPTLGGVLLDVSCGSGLFSRRFAKSGAYSAVVAADFSESMLRQCYEFVKQDSSLEKANLALVRADVARLPFATGSIDAVHAGAALHCWPSPSAGVAEISRILRPGGVFVATTFIASANDIQLDFLKPLQQALRRGSSSSSLRYWLEAELEDLCKTCGLTEYKKIRRRNFIMLSAQKPPSN